MLQLAGWGLTQYFKSSDVLLYLDLPYVSYDNCTNYVPRDFQHYVTPDKFCAGFTNGKISNYFCLHIF